MKKIKIMLMSLALIAVVGGALAFKAKYTIDYCTAPTIANVACDALACPNVSNQRQPDVVGPKICTTTKPAAGCVGVACTMTSTNKLVED